MRKICLVLLLVAIAGCSSEKQEAPPPPIALDGPVEFSLYQRTSVALPGSDDRLVLSIGDITGGQVMTGLAWREGGVVFPTRSIRQGEDVTFRLGDYVYKLRLKRLTNVLIGADNATFQILRATPEMENQVLEEDKIEVLIMSLYKQELGGAKFIRNGREHTVEEAASHLRSQWQWEKAEIKTARDFINMVGSKSSNSGEPYLIKLYDGTELKSAEWFQKQLEELEELIDKAMPQTD